MLPVQQDMKFLPFSAGEEIKFNKYSGESTLGGPD